MQPLKLALPSKQLPTTDLYIVGLLGTISLFLDNPRVKKSSIKSINQAPSTRIKLQTQEVKFEAQVTSYIIKTEKRLKKPNLPAYF